MSAEQVKNAPNIFCADSKFEFNSASAKLIFTLSLVSAMYNDFMFSYLNVFYISASICMLLKMFLQLNTVLSSNTALKGIVILVNLHSIISQVSTARDQS